MNLPENVRKKDEEGDHPSQPQPLVEELPARRRQHESNNHAQPQKSHRVLVHQAHACHQAKQQPKLGIALYEDSDDDVACQRPEDLVETVHGEIIVDGKINRRHHHGNSRKHLRVPPASHLPRQQAGEQNEQSAAERREEA